MDEPRDSWREWLRHAPGETLLTRDSAETASVNTDDLKAGYAHRYGRRPFVEAIGAYNLRVGPVSIPTR